MRSGLLRHQVVLQSPTRIQDEAGSFTNTWSSEGVEWTDIRPINSWDAEKLQAMKIQTETTHKCTMRYHAGLLPTWRVKYGTRYFSIVSIANIEERNITHELYCREVV
jgi:SPP1 family predicted phage head-tail adaptor